MKTKLIPKCQSGEKFSWDNLDDWVANTAEPWSTGIALTGAGIGAGAVATGVGAAPGAIIFTASQVPPILVDGYLTTRSIIKGNYGDAAYNAVELGLDLIGFKVALGLDKAITKFPSSNLKILPGRRIGTGIHHHSPRVRAHLIATERSAYINEAAKASRVLAKRGVRPALGDYFKKKLTEQINKQLIVLNDAIRASSEKLLQSNIFNKVVYPISSLLIQLPFNVHDMELRLHEDK